MYEDYLLKKPVKKKSASPKAVMALCCLGIILIGVTIKPFFFRKSETPITSPLSQNQNPAEVKGVFNPLSFFITKPKIPSNETSLMDSIKKLLATEKGFYSVYIFDLKKNKGLGINETTILTAASVSKVPIISSLYYLAQKGEIDLDNKITLQDTDIQDFGTGVLRNEGAGGVYSIKTLAQLLIQKSDNTAGYILGEQMIGFPKIQELIESWGLTQTDMLQNKTSNKDMAILFTKIYKGQIANQGYTQEMLGFFKDTDFENRLPAQLPKTVPIYHKIGNEVGNVHDVGIVALENNPYYIGVMTNDIIDIEHAEETIATISKMVFDYYFRRSSTVR